MSTLMGGTLDWLDKVKRVNKIQEVSHKRFLVAANMNIKIPKDSNAVKSDKKTEKS